MDCDSIEDKYNALVKLYGLMTIGSSIIFVRTRESAERIQKQMTEEGHKVAMLTGQLEGADRDTTIDNFRSGRAKVLITTNVLARGIDVQSVSMVVNYDVPETKGKSMHLSFHSIGFTLDPAGVLENIKEFSSDEHLSILEISGGDTANYRTKMANNW